MVEPTSLAGEYLTFRIGDAEYGMDILRIQEIRSYEQPTRIDGVPPFLKGVINLRGVMVPIIDLRIVAGLDCPYNAFTVVVVINLSGRIIGVVVDSVSDVLEIAADRVSLVDGSPHPDSHLYIVATANICSRQVALLDIEGLMESLHLIVDATK